MTRICYNSLEWRKPSGDARTLEAANTHNHRNGFGHEEWLFRNEWQIDGWRYGFIQGVNKGRNPLLAKGTPFDLTLFTITPTKQRLYVAGIRAVECLTDKQADEAVAAFKARGWHHLMLQEIKAVQGNAEEFGSTRYAKHVLNVRFRQGNCRIFSPPRTVASDDPVRKLWRYQLYDTRKLRRPPKETTPPKYPGSSDEPTIAPWVRSGTDPVECTPEHARIQAQLMRELEVQYPGKVTREQDFIDVRVCTDTALLLFEIKSDLEPRTVIRQALGQVLEYGFHPRHQHPLPVELVIVGRQKPSKDDARYLEHLRSEFKIPVTYRVVSI
ncbi:MAG: hypothetical protein H7A46_07015 [Verrucomicrobiales bacterium]|nr:hypothetical protein [Verrucomicrobiales bacterium]